MKNLIPNSAVFLAQAGSLVSASQWSEQPNPDESSKSAISTPDSSRLFVYAMSGDLRIHGMTVVDSYDSMMLGCMGDAYDLSEGDFAAQIGNSLDYLEQISPDKEASQLALRLLLGQYAASAHSSGILEKYRYRNNADVHYVVIDGISGTSGRTLQPLAITGNSGQPLSAYRLRSLCSGMSALHKFKSNPAMGHALVDEVDRVASAVA